MTISSTQKVIKIGDSNGVTIPAKDLKRAGIKAGDQIKITFEAISMAPPKTETTLMDEYADFVAQYGQTLKNLSQR